MSIEFDTPFTSKSLKNLPMYSLIRISTTAKIDSREVSYLEVCMAFEVIPVVENRKAAQYDGTNSADFNAAIPDFTITLEDASGLSFTSDGNSYTVAVGGYIVWQGVAVTHVFQNQDDYDEAFASILAALQDLVFNHVHVIELKTGVGYAVTGM